MKVLLLAGYRFDQNAEDAPGLTVDAAGVTQLDRQIAALEALGLSVVCVLSGDSAEAQIRRSPRLRDAEIAYDVNGPNVSLVSNVRAGFAALNAHEPCLILPVEIPCPPRASFASLTHAAYAAPPSVSLAQVDRAGDPRDLGFPLLVTRAGVRRITAMADLKSLADTRLEYLRPSI